MTSYSVLLVLPILMQFINQGSFYHNQCCYNILFSLGYHEHSYLKVKYRTAVNLLPTAKLKQVVLTAILTQGCFSLVPYVKREPDGIQFISQTVKIAEGKPIHFYKILKSEKIFNLKLNTLLLLSSLFVFRFEMHQDVLTIF